jgi:hypothetical protein
MSWFGSGPIQINRHPSESWNLTSSELSKEKGIPAFAGMTVFRIEQGRV